MIIRRVSLSLILGWATMMLTPSYALTLKSPAFDPFSTIPQQYTCDGKDISPPLQWSGAPQGTRSFMLWIFDPDSSAGTWTHWLVYNLPASSTHLSSGLKKLPAGAGVHVNSWHLAEYNGPCPPAGEHRYVFVLYALDKRLPFDPTATPREQLQAMKSHVLASAHFIATYERQSTHALQSQPTRHKT